MLGREASVVFNPEMSKIIGFEYTDKLTDTDIGEVPREVIEEVLVEVCERVAKNLDFRPGEYDCTLPIALKQGLDSGEENLSLVSVIYVFPYGFPFPRGEVKLHVDLESQRVVYFRHRSRATPEVPILNLTNSDAVVIASQASTLPEEVLRSPDDYGLHFYKNPLYLETIGTHGVDGIVYWDFGCVRNRLCYLFFGDGDSALGARIAIDAETGEVLVEERLF
jgi:hypothetical protein